MRITGFNHLTLAVSDLERSVGFYSGLLGFELRWRGADSAYLEAGSLWLALVVDSEMKRGGSPGYSHAAFTVAAAELPQWIERLTGAGAVRWQEADRPDSFYFLDPDGHKLELHAGDLEGRLRLRLRAGSA